MPGDPVTRIAVRPGNFGVGVGRGPENWLIDMSLVKNFRLTERLDLQIRIDMFNATNRVNYSAPSTNVNDATFGEISGAGGMRVVQLNAKLRW